MGFKHIDNTPNGKVYDAKFVARACSNKSMELVKRPSTSKLVQLTQEDLDKLRCKAYAYLIP
ncbi:hypothetical protein BCY91_03915 [Pelobium manganitolerans]|uniref:Uncharacterized protein n=1 Tax=Pelobium manganitolerans TaxID=1842495 RepID=A0A419S7W7_9SPHI|nr:hypothetical protein [Pelobium manganitolerans]RKD17283.1 hypothetical protein BCY91_03915 [Pelobium manganitolerans]